jgi:hypothetical protein
VKRRIASNDVIEALSMIPALRQTERRVYKQWHDNPPESLVYAMVGKTLADCFVDLEPAHRLYAMAIIKSGLDPRHPRGALVREALFGTLKARMRYMDKKRAAAIRTAVEEIGYLAA